MPAFCTHYIFMKELEEYICNNADFKFSKEACQIGTQGPDIFFFSGIIPIGIPQFKIGSALHRAKPAEIFDAFAEYCKFSPDPDVAKSYIYGFILHYALDRNCHPYVYSMQKKLLQKNKHLHKSSAHNEIEMAMDTYLLDKMLNINDTRSFDASITFDAQHEVVLEISHLLSFVISRVTEFSPSEKDVARAIRDTKILQKVLQNRHGITLCMCKLIETLIAPFTGYYKFSSMIRPKDLEKAKKYGNINHMIWTSPFNKKESNLSFEELFRIAEKDAEYLLKGFDAICKGYSKGYEITENISFLTGIEEA